jgi:hypothetical protein
MKTIIIISILLVKVTAAFGQHDSRVVLTPVKIDSMYLATINNLSNFDLWIEDASGPDGTENGERWDTTYFFHLNKKLVLVREYSYQIDPVGFAEWHTIRDKIFDQDKLLLDHVVTYTIDTYKIYQLEDSTIHFKNYPVYYSYDGIQLGNFEPRDTEVKYQGLRTFKEGVRALLNKPLNDKMLAQPKPKLSFSDSVRVAYGKKPLKGLQVEEQPVLRRDDEEQDSYLKKFANYLDKL